MYDESIKVGSTGHILLVTLRNSTTGLGATGIAYNTISGYYSIDGATPVTITLAAGSPGDSYSSGKWAELSAANMPGDYALHVPDAALATGTRTTISLRATSIIDTKVKVKLVSHNVKDANALGLGYLDAAVSSRSSHSASDVWSSPTRTLTSGLNIRLVKDTDIFGFNDLSEANIRTAVGLASANLDTQFSNVIATGMLYWTGGGAAGSLTASDVWSYATRTLTSGLNIRLVKDIDLFGFNDPTSAAIADAVWDETTAGHVAIGSFGTVIANLGSEVWSYTTRLLTAGTNIVLTKGVGVLGLNDLDSNGVASGVWGASRTNFTTNGTFGQGIASVTGSIGALSSNAQSDIRTAVGLASANLDTQFSNVIATGMIYWTGGGAGGSLTAADVWAYTTRTLTSGINIRLVKDTDIFGFNDLSAADVRTAVGLASANLDTQFSNVIATGMIYWTGGGAGGSLTAADVWTYGTRTLTSPLNIVSGIADAVWDEPIAGHLSVGSVGEALNAAGAAGDPWTTALPGAYGAGSAGYILGTNLNTTVSSRSSHSAADVWSVGTRTLTSGLNIRLVKNTDLIGFNDLTGLEVQAEVISGLIVYDGPTKAELDTVAANIIATGMNEWITAVGFSTHSVADIWSNTTRTLTSGVNIRLVKGVDVFGFNDLSQSDIRSAVGLATNDLDSQLAGIITHGDTSWVTATGFSTHSPADVWSYGTRTLTSGLNIRLVKNTELIGFNDLSEANVRTAVGLASANLDTQLLNISGLIDTEIASILSTLGTNGDGLTNIPWNNNWNAGVYSGCYTAISGFNPLTMSGIYDGTKTVKQLFRGLGAWMKGKAVVTNLGGGSSRLRFYAEDDTTTVVDITVLTSDGTRATGGTLT